jgi:hypothetical protein
MKNNLKIKRGLFILHEGINSTIFNSQVLEHVLALKKKGIHFDILSFNTENKIWKKSVLNKQKVNKQFPSINIYLFKSINIFYPFAFIIHSFSLLIFLYFSKVKYDFIHSRSDYTQFISLITKKFHKINSVWDCRGHSISEIFFSLKKKNFIYKIYGNLYILPLFRTIIKYNSSKSDGIIFISKNLKFEINKISKRIIRNIIIVPCLVNEKLFYFEASLRVESRKRLKIEQSQTVFIYSGSMVAYQSIEIQKKLYKKILSDKNNILVILTNHIKEAELLFEKIKSKRLKIFSSEFNKINEYFNLADFSILIRNNEKLNYVASPTKFGEYCMSGLPVIMNNTVKQAFDNSKKIGNYFDWNNTDFKKCSDSIRKTVSKKSQIYYSRKKYIDIYKVFYFNTIKN